MPDTNNIPIKWGKYINHDMEEEKVIFIGAEKAIYDSNGRKLDAKLIDMEDSLSDAFSETKDYAAGDYCVYTNRVFKFTKAKSAGSWDGTAVIPVSLAQEIAANSQGISTLKGQFQIGKILGQSYYTGSDAIDANEINRYFVLCKGTNLPDSTSFWFLQTIIFQLGSDGFPMRGKQIAYKYDGSQIFERHKAYDQDWSAWNEYALKSDLAIKIGVPVSTYGTFGSNSYVKRSGNVISAYIDFTATKEYTQWSDTLFQLPSGFGGDSKYTLMAIPMPVSNSSTEKSTVGTLAEGYKFQLGKNLASGERIVISFTVVY